MHLISPCPCYSKIVVSSPKFAAIRESVDSLCRDGADAQHRSVPQISSPFCNISLSTKRRGGLYAGCDDFSRDYALPSGTGKAWPLCRWGPSSRRRDAPDATSRLTSFSVEGRGSRALPWSSGHVYRWCGRFVFAVDTLMVESRVA